MQFAKILETGSRHRVDKLPQFNGVAVEVEQVEHIKQRHGLLVNLSVHAQRRENVIHRLLDDELTTSDKRIGPFPSAGAGLVDVLEEKDVKALTIIF